MKAEVTRRVFLRYLALGAGTAALAACAAPVVEPETQIVKETVEVEKVVKETVEVEKVVKETVLVSKEHVNLRIGWWGALARNDLYNELCDMYQDIDPDVTLIREYAQWGDYWIKVATQAAAGSLPDISASVFDTLAEYGERGVYMPLNAMVDAGAIDLSDWDPVVANCGKVKDSVYQIPTGVCVNCIVLNEDLIGNAGLEVPKFETSYDEWAAFCSQLQSELPEQTWASDFGPLNQHHFQGWILQNGYQIADETGTSVGFPKEVVVELFEYWMELYNAGYIIPIDVYNQPLNDWWADAHLSVGRIATGFTDNNELKIYQNYNDDNLVIIRQLVMPDGAYRTGDFLRGSGWSLSTTSEYQDAAAGFVNWFVNDLEAAKIFSMELGALGSQSVAEALRDSIHPKDVLVLDHFNEILKELPPKMVDPKGTAAVLTARERMCNSILYGAAIEDAVDDFMAEAEEIYRSASA